MTDPRERYVERMGTALADAGLQRLPSRVFAALTVDDDGRMTSAELVEALGVSPASVSGAVRYLSQIGFVHRERERGTPSRRLRRRRRRVAAGHAPRGPGVRPDGGGARRGAAPARPRLARAPAAAADARVPGRSSARRWAASPSAGWRTASSWSAGSASVRRVTYATPRHHRPRRCAGSPSTGSAPTGSRASSPACSAGGELVWGDGIGRRARRTRDGAPGADDQFLVASNSKTFTAVMVMQLRDEGRLDLDDRVADHLPEVTHPLTVRQGARPRVGPAARAGRRRLGDPRAARRPRSCSPGFVEAEAVGRPHDRWHYSNTVYAILGELVARLDGRSWEESLRARLLDPLELRRTSVGFDDGPQASGYYVAPYDDVPRPEPVLGPQGDGALRRAGQHRRRPGALVGLRRRPRLRRCSPPTPWRRCASRRR